MSERDFLAAELAFGLLDGDDLERAIELRRNDAPFDAMVKRWDEQTSLELLAIEPVSPPAALWQRIDEAMPKKAIILPFASPSNDSQLVRKLAFWRTGAIVGGSIAALLALVITTGLPTMSEPSAEIAALENRLATVQIVDGSDQPIAIAIFDQAAGTMRVRLAIDDRSDVVPEFWVIPADGTPRSLGRLARSDSLTAEQRALIFAGGQFAVSLEPDDGETSAAPRGQVLGAGVIQLL